MEINKCLKVMDLSVNYTKKDLNSKYKKLVLIYHPDRSLIDKEKNSEKFKEITEAYNILKNYEIEKRKDCKSNNFTIENIFETGINMIKILIENTYINKKIDVDIDNLINKDIFVMEYENEKLYIPMWHHELVFEINNKKIIIECNRKLNENIVIDDENNIIVKVFLKIEYLKNRKDINIIISKNLLLKIDIDKLYICKNQMIIFKNKGIPIINEKNIYFEETLSDIYIEIIIEDLI